MSKPALSARMQLERWRSQGADQLDPVRFHLMKSLAARADAQADAVREVLEHKLGALVDDYATALKQATRRPVGRGAAAASTPGSSQSSALGALTGQMAGHAALMEVDSRKTASADAMLFPELPALDDFRRTWTTVRTASQVRQSLQDAPKDAGPLNSNVLVHRCITLMRECSPGYLQHFLGYVDALSWLEQLHTGGALANEETTPVTPGKKRSKSPSKRRG
ncbi:TPA: DUF2894 domain-containing protein [Xanthomonas vasicola pv. zeae]|uniref:DUF2894 domain-containing protein n=1 Tax=Xanthomonas vasicola pv. vasculorum TaxID=325776 RepID=A0AAE8JX54_XANVA|nr:DUF2894 domain-containing protein [Xanthomonas vasicola]KFA15672.1 hypothetical protein KWS_0127305 [Xanthomonas vasicola pv. musacearum NCPPB 4384]AVQ08422.1 DUF2894 domain-containing protein [Xanthomonas vasicola pv. vasculorum]AZM72618.1 DUF2894 domain-containing protein [Xanthomonas vasicola pv. vasculorum]AZR32577.1 DUF2894 domain-containing protein [Xanthomonas vasicola pv. musacearum NCPPB 4379]KFA11165.1 hypothetical protein KWM_0107215 [Xanthomonas vasicola pv. musacearum NCPPB 200